MELFNCQTTEFLDLVEKILETEESEKEIAEKEQEKN